MRKDIERLLIVQEHDRRIAQCRHVFSEIPTRKTKLESDIINKTEALQKVKDVLKSERAMINKFDMEIESVRQHVAKLRGQQLQIKSNQEYKALSKEISNAESKVSIMEDSQLELMEKMEAKEAQTAKIESDTNDEKTLIGQEINQLEKKRESLALVIDQLKGERENLASEIDESWLSRYNAIMENKGDIGIAGTDASGTCEACHMNLPPQVVNDVKKEGSMVSCSFCGRLLYWAD